MLGRKETPAIPRKIAALFHLFHEKSEHMKQAAV
jgi:hypothetical protein